MDNSMIEATQALEFDDFDEETNNENETVAYLNVPCQKGFPGKLYPITEGDNVVGRGDHCGICIPLKGLSREHACIEVKGGNHFIYDKGSRNKTRRNNFFLATSVRYELKDKDKLIFGDVNCSYQVGTEVQAEDDDQTGSETGSESMFETAPVADSITIMDTPAPHPRNKKGFADDFTIPESESDTDDDNQKTAQTTLVADSQDADETVDKLMGAPTQAFVCDSDVTTDDDDSPKKKSLLLAATQGYLMDTESDDDTPNTHSLLTAATQAYTPDSDESSSKKVVKKQPEIVATMKYDMTVGIEETQGYDMDDEEETKDQEERSQETQSFHGEDAERTRLLCEATQAFDEKEGKGAQRAGSTSDETQSFGGNDAEDEEKTRLLCEATQAFLGNEGDGDEMCDEEDASDNSKLLAEPTQAFLGDKEENEDKGDNQSESSGEFVLEGDTDNEDDSDDVSHMFAAPTLACDADEDVQSEDEVNDDQTVKHDDATQAVSDDVTQVVNDDATAKVNEDDQTVAVAEETVGKGSSDTQVVQEDVTQPILNDATVQVTEDQTVAIAEDTVAILDEATMKVTEEDQTVALTGDTVAILDEATMKVTEEDQTVAIGGDTVAILDEATVKVTEEDQTVAITEDTVAILDEATMKVTEEDQTVDIAGDIVAILDEATVKVTEEDQTVAIAGDTVEVSETVPVEDIADKAETIAVSDNVDNNYLPEDTVPVKDDITETVQVPETMIIPESSVNKTVPVENEESTETLVIEESDPVSNVDNENQAEDAALVKDTEIVQNGKKKGKSIVPKNKQSTGNATKDIEGVNLAADTPGKVEDVPDKVRGKRGRSNKQTKESDKSTVDTEKEPEQLDPGSTVLGRGKRGKAVKDYNAIVNKGRASKRKSVQTADAEHMTVTEVSKEQNVPENKMKEPVAELQESASNEDQETEKKELDANKASSRNSRSRGKKTKEPVCQEKPLNTVKNTQNKQSEIQSSEVIVQTGRGKRNKKVIETASNTDQEPFGEANIDEKLEPETQAYMEASPRKGHNTEEATQRYPDEDATPSLSEDIGEDSEETDPLILPQPTAVPLPSRSPLKSALVSPEKKKSPSPKRVQFVSQESETGSESSQPSGRSRRSKQALDLNTVEKPVQESKKGKGKLKTKQNKSSTQKLETVEAEGTSETSDCIAAPLTNLNESKSLRVSNRQKQETKIEITDSTDNGNVPQTSKRLVRGKPVNEAVPKGKGAEKVEGDVKTNTTAASANTNKRKGRGKKSEVNETGDSNIGVNESDRTVFTGEVIEETEDKLKAASTSTSETQGKEIGEIYKNEDIDSDIKNVDSKVKRPTRGKVKQIEANEKGETITQSKRISRGRPQSNVVNESEDSEQQNSQDSDKGSKNKRKTRSEPIEKEEEVIDEATTVKQTAKNRRTTHGVNTKKVEESETVTEPVSESVKGKRARNKQTNEKQEVLEEIKQTTRGRRTKVGVSDATEKESVKTEISDTKESAAQEPVKGNKRKINQVKDNENSTASKTNKSSTSANSESQSSDKGSISDSEIKPLPKRGRSKQTKSVEPVGVKKEISEETNEDTVTSSPSVNRRAGKRKGTDDGSADSNDLRKGETPAKKQKLKETQSTPQSSTKLDVTTPKSTLKKDTSFDTPKGKQLDTTFTGSPTLRKTTTNGVKPKVLFTGVTDEQGEKIVKDLGGELPTSVMECTHLVTDQIRRTVKFLCCLARGIPIVSPQWLVSSKKSGFFADTTPHIIRDDASEKKFKCNLHRSINKASEASLLTGYKIHVTKSVKPGPDQMKDILKCAGAQYLATIPKMSSPTTLLISCAEDKPQCESAIRQGVTVVNAEFVLTGILRQEVDINSYLLFPETQGKALSSQEPTSKKRKR